MIKRDANHAAARIRENFAVARFQFRRVAVVLLAFGLTGLLAPGCNRPAPAKVSMTTVTFPTEDGGEVEADVYGEGEKVVILAHGGRFTKESWHDQAEPLARAGFRVIAINFRGRGRSRGGSGNAQRNGGYALDVLAAIHFARQSGAKDVSVIGASFGGWAASKAATLAPDEIDRLVLLAAPVVDLSKVTCPKLFIVSRNDARGGGRLRLPEIRAQFEHTPEPKQLLVLEGHAHAQFIFETDQGPRLLTEIIRFLTAPNTQR